MPPVSSFPPTTTRSRQPARRVRRLRQAACERCEREPDRHCPACAARMQHAVRLVVGCGLPIPEAATRLRLSASRVERLLEQHADRERVSAYALDEISNESLRRLLADAQSSDPRMTTGELARR